MAGPSTQQQGAKDRVDEPYKKRIIICCDGTWMNSDKGWEKQGLFSKDVQQPSNVTRMSRSFRKHCSNRTVQIIYYQAGVGTGTTLSDTITGGVFGTGVAENIREAYSFICANWDDGDEIVLVGFSRGAFTARSVAGMIGALGLLNRKGMECFFPIFTDYENSNISDYDDEFPDKPFGPGVPKPKRGRDSGFQDKYREMLVKHGMTREMDSKTGERIKVTCVACFDTVGSLGIPKVEWWPFRHPNKEYMFYDTKLSNHVLHAFQALALDETRGPFSPALWERTEDNTTTDLRQVWFPGNHANIGGGWPDQGVANITMAWMMDQMASVSVEFDDRAVDAIFKQTVDWYKTKGNAPVKSGWFSSSELCWTGLPDLFETYGPVRPFGLGAIRNASNPIYGLAGRVIRTPGFYHKVDPETARIVPHELLKNTNERIHNSVRVRLACGGLGLDDSGPWACEALAGKWKLDRARADDHIVDPIRPDANWWPKCAPPGSQEFTANLDGGQRWVWRWAGPQYEDGEEPDVSPSNGTSSNGAGARRAAAPAVKAKKTSPKKVPLQKILVEEPSGPYERYLLYLGEEQRKSLKGSVIEVAKNKDWKGSEWLHPNCS